ncbi:NAD-dependent epimerase/dehydratase family protein [Jannaschia aquimarina]|uniref:NAD dependent epimerase/dehydratase family protein n=1 Tax=Jannaschia aquimarina TaxID=935700 RepID=A0A0D1EJ56_9RHOB|nr:NAD-dependent epimerase/dehydratase family protein [Jannaschia aquimarina]KIT17006.1 NAD dependent epimerase/dehydratase family protein [Jannaschia aquimarina]SNS81319.1 NAD dependent epimerase/dehydratase family protein [Jannaschia aquimarina]
MQRVAPPPRTIVTGASGRVARLLRAVWGETVEWRSRAGGDPLADLPEGGSLLCLAGIVPGAGDLAENARIARKTLDAAGRVGLRRVLLMSSAAVYPVGERLTEAQAAPFSDYGRAKLAMETEAQGADVETCCLRLGNLAGADALLGRLTRADPVLDVFADGRVPRRSYIGPVSLANALARLLTLPQPLPPVLNLAAPGVVGMDELLSAAGRAWISRPAPETAIPVIGLDTAALRALVPIGDDDGDPAEIVRQWRQVRP